MRLWDHIGRGIGRHPVAVLAAVAVTTLGVGPGLRQLEFRSSQDTMIPSGSPVAEVNRRYQAQFGGEAMVVLFEGDIRSLFSPTNQRELRRLEADLEADRDVHAVLSPLTTLRFAADQVRIAAPLAVAGLERAVAAAPDDAARRALRATFAARAADDGRRLATAGEQTLTNARFVDFLLFGADGAVRDGMRGMFPDDRHAVMVVRQRGNLTIDDQGASTRRIVALVEARRFDGLDVLPTGSPVLLKSVNDRMKSDMALTGAIAMIVMALLVLLLAPGRWRLVTLAAALFGVVWAFGVLGFVGVPLTMVTISGLPILIGLGVDVAVQVHARHTEEAARSGPGAGAAERALSRLGPALGVGTAAAVGGLLALRWSRVPMVRDFGVMLAVGVLAAVVAVVAVVPALLVVLDRRVRRPRPRASEGRLERLVSAVARRGGRRRLPVVVVVVMVLAVGVGALASRATPVENDPERFVPQDDPVLADLRRVRDVAGSSADLGLLVEADDVLRPDVIDWMTSFQERALTRHPTDLLSGDSVASIAQQVVGAPPLPSDVEAVLAVAPRSIVRTFVSDDRTRAHVVFAIGHVTLGEQKRLIADLTSDLHAPPGVRVSASGLAVVGIEAVDALRANRAPMTAAALAAVLLVLAALWRSPRRAAIVLVPVVTATGLANVVVYLLGVRVSVLGDLSSPLVVAIATEFAVLLEHRYREELLAGRPAPEALATAVRRIGRAFTVSGLTTATGFAVLAASGFPLLSSFGIVVSVNLLAALACTLVLLPPLLAARSPSGVEPRAVSAARSRWGRRRGSSSSTSGSATARA